MTIMKSIKLRLSFYTKSYQIIVIQLSESRLWGYKRSYPYFSPS
ncbi:hypothetical protein VCHA37P193_110162 [Vibrio chagasii]|nr:hypothetical protein VCHA41O249_100173 [Vibrio chagasii]CAH6908019.1 hypothetical protein VCHA37P193_110162 [Vibrio chagasii]CAH7177679.1 hypothetical protein VCHA42O253_120014 [Vibrio chagasii]